MNALQREIIADHYRNYLECNLRSDPVGGYMDLKALFSDLAATDAKLGRELWSILHEIFPDDAALSDFKPNDPEA